MKQGKTSKDALKNKILVNSTYGQAKQYSYMKQKQLSHSYSEKQLCDSSLLH